MCAAGYMLDIFVLAAAGTAVMVPKLPSFHPLSLTVNLCSLFYHPSSFAWTELHQGGSIHLRLLGRSFAEAAPMSSQYIHRFEEARMIFLDTQYSSVTGV
jgi:hypothetical protein